MNDFDKVDFRMFLYLPTSWESYLTWYWAHLEFTFSLKFTNQQRESNDKTNTHDGGALSSSLEVLHPKGKHCWDLLMSLWKLWTPVSETHQSPYLTHQSCLSLCVDGVGFNMANIPYVVCAFLRWHEVNHPNISKEAWLRKYPECLLVSGIH